jgi:hypothetical protein
LRGHQYIGHFEILSAAFFILSATFGFYLPLGPIYRSLSDFICHLDQYIGHFRILSATWTNISAAIQFYLLLGPPLIFLQINDPAQPYLDAFSLKRKPLFIIGLVILDGDLPFSVDDAVPGEAVLLAHRMEGADDLAGRTGASSEPGDLAVSRHLALGDTANNFHYIFCKRCHGYRPFKYTYQKGIKDIIILKIIFAKIAQKYVSYWLRIHFFSFICTIIIIFE